MIAAKSGRVSGGPKSASDVTMPPAEKPIMPTRSGRKPNSPARSPDEPHGLLAVVGRHRDQVLTGLGLVLAGQGESSRGRSPDGRARLRGASGPV